MYYVQPVGSTAAPWAVREHGSGVSSGAIDLFRSEAGARHAAELLNGGLARIERHRPIGCRIQPIYAAARGERYAAARAARYAAPRGERAA
jgi:hypothetical protein